MNLWLLYVDELPRFSGQKRHENRQSLRHAKSNIGYANHVHHVACTVWQSPNAQFNLRVIYCRSNDGVRKVKMSKSSTQGLQLFLLFFTLPLCYNTGCIIIESTRKSAANRSHRVGARRIAPQAWQMDYC